MEAVAQRELEVVSAPTPGHPVAERLSPAMPRNEGQSGRVYEVGMLVGRVN
jgi:hypothetical protein